MSAINFHLYLNRDGCRTWSICNTSYDSFWSQFMPEEISCDLYSAMLLVIGEILNQLSWGISRCCQDFIYVSTWAMFSSISGLKFLNAWPIIPTPLHARLKRAMMFANGKALVEGCWYFIKLDFDDCPNMFKILAHLGGRISPNPTLPSRYLFCLGNTYVSVVKRHPMCSYVPWRWNHHSLMWTLRCWEFTNQARDNWDFS